MSTPDLGEKDRGLITTYVWALANLRDHFPFWNADIERLDAHTALFRTMSLVLVLTAVLEFFHFDWTWGFVSTGTAKLLLMANDDGDVEPS
jgi:hypothetical protein